MPLKTLLSFATAALVGLLAAPASAQGFRLLVAPGEVSGVSTQEFEDLVEESAYLAEDFGGFEVVRWYQLGDYVSPTVESQVLGCGYDAGCHVDALFGSAFDYLLLVSAFDEGSSVVVDYQMIDTTVGVLATQTEAYLPTAQDYPYLLVPCHDALKVTPEWIPPRPQQPPPPAPIVTSPAPEPRLGRVGRIGAYTAGAGSAVFLGGVLLGFGADETQQEIQAEPHPRSQLESLQSKGQRQQRMANAFMILGGTAIAGGVGLVVFDRVSEDDATVSLGTDGSSLWVRTEF